VVRVKRVGSAAVVCCLSSTTVNQKVLPLPGSLFNPISPAITWQICRAIDKPSPVPP
jgi:hypothetical protein